MFYFTSYILEFMGESFQDLSELRNLRLTFNSASECCITDSMIASMILQ